MNPQARQLPGMAVAPPAGGNGGGPNATGRSRVRGFSLLELTLAMTIVAMLALTLYSFMQVTLRARRSASASVSSIRAATIAMDLVCGDLQSVLAPKGNYAGPFVGMRQDNAGTDADMLDFFSIGRDADPALLNRPWSEGIREITLMLDTGVNPPNLLRRITRNLQPKVETDPDEEVLCRGVKSLAIRYYDGFDWQEEWDSVSMGDVLPMAVAITIELSDEGNAASPQSANPANRITRIVPLACAKPSSSTGVTQ